MTALAEPAVLGDQRPRIAHVPPAAETSSADDAIDLAAACGLELDDWQQWVLRQSLGEREDGKWAAYDVGLVVARQNGKGAVLMAREIAGALLFGERLIVHSAHELDTARDHLKKLDLLAEESAFLRAHLPAEGIKWGRGYEEAKFANGSVIRFKSRTRKGGRGLSGDLVVFDEAFELEDVTVGAMQPLLRARPNPQLWYASSVVDQVSMPNSLVLARLRQRALDDDAGRMAYMEWSNPDDFAEVPAGELHSKITDVDAWSRANPALGIRVDVEQMATEVDSMPLRQFLVECMSVGDWPNLNGPDRDGGPLPLSLWTQRIDTSDDAVAKNPVVFAVDVSPDRAWASIGAAGWTSDGRCAVELIDRRAGVGWVTGRLGELMGHKPAAVVVDGYLNLEGVADVVGQVPLLTSGAHDMAQACAELVDAAVDGSLAHLGQPELEAAVDVVETRSLAGGFAWKRPKGADVTALVAVTLAQWGLKHPPDRAPTAPIVFVT